MFRAVLCCALSLCFVLAGALSVEALTWPSSGSNLLPHDSTPSALTSTAYNGRLYLCWRGTSDNKLYMASSPDGTRWTTSSTPLPTDQTSSSPRLGVIGGDVGMYVLWAGLNNGIYFSNSTDGLIWEPTRQILANTDGSPFAPSLVYVGFENLYYLVWHAITGDAFYMSISSDLHNWQPSQRILPNDGSPAAPILFVNGQTLKLFWQGNDNHFYQAQAVLGTWSKSSNFLPTDVSPAELRGFFFNGATLYITWQGVGDNGIYISSTSDFGANWQQSQRIITNDQTGAAVAITQFNQQLYLAYKSTSSQAFSIAASQ